MFNSARLKLTGWYLLIIMVISLSFSMVLYRLLTLEVDRLLARQNARFEQQFTPEPTFTHGSTGVRFAMPLLDPELVEELKKRLIFNFAVINGLIFIGAGGLGFMLAGKTLSPIKVMIDEQNRFIADASHELRTPITALKTNLEVSLRDEKLSLKEAKETLTANLEDVNRLQTLSNALLELTLRQQRPMTRFEPAALSSAVTEAVTVVKPLAKAKAIRLKTNVLDATLAIPAKELTDVLIILLDNAIKYSPEKTTVGLQTLKHDNTVSIKIIDQGIGISSKDLPHIFDRFYQVETSRSGNTRKGYGLGLAIAKQTIERNRGSISVISEVNMGTTFVVRLRTV